jgi:hypothetical protein
MTPTRRRIVTSAGVLAGLLFILVLAFVAVRPAIIHARLESPTTGVIGGEDVVLQGFPVYGQAYANSCGPTTISMIYSFLIEPVSEGDLADQLDIPLGRSGMLPGQFANVLQTALARHGYQVRHSVNVPDAVFVQRVYEQLMQGIPTPIYFSTLNAWDRPNFDTHYSVIIGLKPREQVVIVANAYGFREEMTIRDLLAGMKYENYRDAPLNFRLGLLAGLIDRNNLYELVPGDGRGPRS